MENFKIFLGYILICLIWGSTWLAIKIGLESFSPLYSAGLRFLLSGAIIWVIMKIKGIKLQVDESSLKLYISLALFSFLMPFGLVYWAEQHISSGLASILFGVFPFIVILFSAFMIPGKKVPTSQIVGVVLGFIGLLIIFSDDINVGYYGLYGMLGVVAGAAMQAYVAVLIKKEGQHLHPLAMNMLPVFLSGFFLCLGGVLFEDMNTQKYDASGLLSVLYLSVLGTVMAFTTYYWLLKRINLVLLSITAFITPIVAVILGVIVLSEKLSREDIIGSSFVLIGILFANFRGLKNYYFSFGNGKSNA